MSNVRRIYVEKKKPYAQASERVLQELSEYLGVKGIKNVRRLVRYDCENISDDTFEKAKEGIFAEAPLDDYYEDKFKKGKTDFIFSIEFLPGQFDQRADSAIQCIKLIAPAEDVLIRTALTYVIEGDVADKDKKKIKNYLINPVDQQEASEDIPDTLEPEYKEPGDIETIDGFIDLSESELGDTFERLGLAMTLEDFACIHKYFKRKEQRDPTITEIRVLDTYWSDHCRHTTFLTELKDVKIGEGFYKPEFDDSYRQYLRDHKKLYGEKKDKYYCLMDMATLAMKKMILNGDLKDKEDTQEVNACSVIVPIEVDGKEEEWLISFKNETHNHPTEIEPYGGAATCLGGAIRDPLSGRSYVYQAMRVTGAADPHTSLSKTMKGKLPQRKIVTEAAKGYSSYGNQVGIATGLVKEFYHPGYAAKRLEIGAVIGAAPRKNVIRENPAAGDVVILLGGRTGRDGIGGATGSSKTHTKSSVDVCAAEVQKGNPPTERKIQRLFMRPEASVLIKKCNDFGAGGVSVAIGELADGVNIDLDKIPKKYEGLDGTELAISESQERMAVVISPENADKFIKLATEENLEAVPVAEITKEKRLVLNWRGEKIADISREFLDTNGARLTAEAFIEIPKEEDSPLNTPEVKDWKKTWLGLLSDLNNCSQQGLNEMFDSTIGAGSVTSHYGGEYKKSETQTMIHKIPTDKKCSMVTLMSYGMDPYLAEWSPFHAASWSIVDSVAKIVASGGDCEKVKLSFQEYFGKPGDDPVKWGKPAAALLGAHQAQISFGIPSLGGKDSMSGSFEDIDVPPTFCSFAVGIADESDLITPEIKQVGSYICKFEAHKDVHELPIYEQLLMTYSDINRCIKEGVVVSAYALDNTGIVGALSKMAFGSNIGVKLDEHVTIRDIFNPTYGSLLVEIPADKMNYHFGRINMDKKIIGVTTQEPVFEYQGKKLSLEEALTAWEKPLSDIYPLYSKGSEDIKDKKINKAVFKADNIYVCKNKKAKPNVFIPAFPGTNCELDSARAFEAAGAKTDIKIFKNLSADDIKDSASVFKKAIDKAQIVMLPGGFSAGDEPDGSAKFFAAAFRNEKIKEALQGLLDKRDGLILGICNGFQALIKLGLVPYGNICEYDTDSPALALNTIDRHIHKYTDIKVTSNLSPWLSLAKSGGVYVNPVSHGEGRFCAPDKVIKELFKNGQIATRYCAPDGNVYLDEKYNINGSDMAIEGITSPDGRVYGKMSHPERINESTGINIYGERDMKIFEAGVKYFK